MKIKWGLVDSDERFISNFKTYIQTYHNNEIDLYVFKNILEYNQYDHISKLNILMVSENLFSEIDFSESKVTKIILTLTSDVRNNTDELYFINRFNSSKQIVEQTLTIYYENNRMALVEAANNRPSEIISFYSPIGGSGKTTLSIIYGKMLAESGKKVLYMTFDQYADLDLMIEYKDTYDITYLLASYGEGVDLASELDKIKVVDPKTGLHFVKSIQRYKDLVELNATEDPYWKWFVTALIEVKGYDYILLDIPTDLNAKHIDMLNIASSVYVVINKGTVEKSKVHRFNEQLYTFEFYTKHNELGTLRYIVNDSKNVGSGTGYDGTEINVVKTIPFDSKFKVYDQNKNKLVLKTDTLIGESLRTLISIGV